MMGPKDSSMAIKVPSSTSVNTVGSMKKPIHREINTILMVSLVYVFRDYFTETPKKYYY